MQEQLSALATQGSPVNADPESWGRRCVLVSSLLMWKKKWPSHCVDSAQQPHCVDSAQQQLTYQGVINPAFLTDPKQCNMGWQRRVNSIPARHSAAQNTVQMAWEVTPAHATSGARLCVCCASTMHPQPWSQTYPHCQKGLQCCCVTSQVR